MGNTNWRRDFESRQHMEGDLTSLDEVYLERQSGKKRAKAASRTPNMEKLGRAAGSEEGGSQESGAGSIVRAAERSSEVRS